MLIRHEHRQTFVATSIVLASGFLFGALAHAVGWLPLGGLENEPRLLPSAAIELVCGLVLLGAAFALRSLRPGAFRQALGAHALALAGVVIGMIALTLGLAYYTEGNMIYHGIMALLVALNMAGLWRSRPRNPIKRAQHEIAARMY